MSEKARRYETWQDVVDRIDVIAAEQYGFKAKLAAAVGIGSNQLGNCINRRPDTGKPAEPRWSLGRAIVEYLEANYPE